MALFYILLALGVVLINFRNIPHVFYSIIYGAFRPRAVTGGVVGSFFLSMKKGVSRGIFSNEAGLGTGSIAHACADTRKPVKQGLFGIFEVFADTIVICTLTALVILCSGTPVTYGQAAGAELTISGFTSVYGSWISIFTAVAMCCFAFSTIIGWGLYGARCIEFLFSSEKVVKPFMVVYSLVAILGATVELGLLWSIAETFNGLMAIPNLIAVFLLSGTVVKTGEGVFCYGRKINLFKRETPESQCEIQAFFHLSGLSCIAFFILVSPNISALFLLLGISSHIPIIEECFYLFCPRIAYMPQQQYQYLLLFVFVEYHIMSSPCCMW